jgi:hypothetical protein
MSKAPEALASCLALFLQTFIVLPLWYYLLYQILSRVNATSAMWAAYWTYVPIGILVAVIAGIVKALSNSDD